MDSYTYEVTINDNHKESGRIDIPVNLKNEFNIKYVNWAYMMINGTKHRIYMQGKDDGSYIMWKNSNLLQKFNPGDRLEITLLPQEPIYYKESPYTYDSPVRVIDSISYIKEPTSYLCGQSCIAMLAAKPVEEVIDIMNTEKGTHIEHIKSALEYYGISHKKSLKKYVPGMKLPNICILELQLPKYKYWSLFFKGKYYDPEFGILDNCTHDSVLLRFLEVLTL